MKNTKVRNTHYLSLSYNSLITNKYFHYFLFLIDVSIILLQIIEIYHNEYKSLKEEGIKYSSFISITIKEIDKLKKGFKFLIYIIIILIETIFTFILNHFSLVQNNFWKIIINITEIIFHRLGLLFLFFFLFSFGDYLLIIGIILTLPYLILLVQCINANHLFSFFLSLIKYPYDNFSKTIDIYLLIIKIFLSISGMTGKRNLSKLFFILSVLFLFILQIYLTYILINKSYNIMNNVFLNKVRYSILLTNCIIIILVLTINKSEIYNTYLIICFANVLLLTLILIVIFYDPYQFVKFDTDDNMENAFFYFFVLDKNKNKNLLLEMKIEEHRNKCGRCNLCKKYAEAKINEKFENIDLYYIIYNNQNNVLNLMNKIIRELKKQDNKNTFSNNSYYLINLTYIYCVAISQNDPCFFLNTELIYHLLNSENNQYLEEYKLYLNRIKYTNNFIIKAKEIIEVFYKLFEEKKLEKKYEIIFNFVVLLNELKYKEIKNNNNISNYNNSGNTTDKNLNCSNLLTICSIFYEELYNESISNSKIYIRDSQNLLEDLINNNYKNHKLITVEINIQNFQVKIIRAGGYMNKYENTSLFDLFPEIFKNKQISSMKKNLLNMNSENQKSIKNNKANRLKNKEGENQYLDFSFLIEEKDENNIYYKLLKLELNLVTLKDIKTIIYLNGCYKIDKDIIITEQRKNVEFLLHFGNKEQEHLIEGISKENKIIIKQRHGNKYLGNKKLIKDENSLKGCKHYQVYHFLLPSKKNIYSRTNRQDLDNLVNEYNEDKINNSGNSDKLLFNDMASQSSSVTSSISRNNLMLYNRGNKLSQSGEEFSKGFLNSKYILWIGILILFIAFIIEYILLKTTNSGLKKKVNFYLHINYFSLIFNRLFCSILSLSCIGVSPDSNECVNHIDSYSVKTIIDSLVNTTNSQNDTDINNGLTVIKRMFVDFKEFLFNQEQILSDILETATEQITNDLAEINDDELKQFFDGNIPYFKINQNFENQVLKLSIKQENLTFTDALLLITSRCSILSKQYSDLNESIYILNKLELDGDIFQNINKNNKLNAYQENYYLLMLDDTQFFIYLNNTIYQIETILERTTKNFKIYVFFVMGLNAFLYFIIFFCLFWYISIHLIIIFQLLRSINTFLNDKLGEINIKDIMKKKIDNLKLLLSFYEKDINSTINELNLIYNNYKESYNIKIKEETKQVKKEVKNDKDNNKNNFSFFQILNFKYFKIFFSYSTKRTMYIYSILVTIIIIVILFTIYIIMWVFEFNKESNASKWLHLARELSKSTNDLMANFLIMTYTNQTFFGVSSHLESKDFTSFIYSKLSDLYEAGGYLNGIHKYMIYDQNNINYNCQQFYENLDNPIFIKIVERYDKMGLKTQLYFTLEFFCEISNIMSFNNYKTAYMLLFNPIESIMQVYKDGNYSDIIQFIEENNLAKIEIFYFIMYIYLLDLMNENIENTYILLVEDIRNHIDYMGLIFLIAFIHLITSVFLIFHRNMDKDCQNFIQMRKIFKICNINE